MTVSEWHNKVASESIAILSDLREFYEIRTLDKLPGLTWNAVFKGAGPSNQYCVKVFNEQTTGVRRTLSDLSYVAYTMHALRESGFTAVLPPIVGRDGAYVHRCAGYWVLTFPWFRIQDAIVLSEERSQHIDEASMAARLLSRLHIAAKNVASLIPALRTRDLPYTLKPSSWIDCANSLWSRVEENLRSSGTAQESLSALRTAVALTNELVHEHPWFFNDLASEETLVHGDFRPENIFLKYRGHGVVFDFDQVHVSYAETDVAYAMLSFSGPRWFVGSRDWVVAHAFLKSYESSKEGVPFSMERLKVALPWSILKQISLSFKAGQVIGRLKLYREMQENITRFSDIYNRLGYQVANDPDTKKAAQT